MIFRRFAAFAVAILAVLFIAGATMAADGPASDPKPHPALWRIRNGASTVYLFGSLHILPRGLAWTTPEIDAAMSAANLFVFEVPVDEEALMDEKQFILENGIYPRGRSLRSYLSQEEFRRYSLTMKRAGLPPWQYERFRPWLASVMLGLAYLHQDDFTSLAGADETILSYAKAHERKTHYLESPSEQMSLIMQGDEHVQMLSLKTLIYNLSHARGQERELLQTWASGDAQRFSGLIDGYFEGRPQMRDLLVEHRNRNWMASLKQYLDSGTTTLVTVGAAHIGGDMGLLALLCGANYDVERVGEGGAPPAKLCGPKA